MKYYFKVISCEGDFYRKANHYRFHIKTNPNLGWNFDVDVSKTLKLGKTLSCFAEDRDIYIRCNIIHKEPHQNIYLSTKKQYLRFLEKHPEVLI